METNIFYKAVLFIGKNESLWRLSKNKYLSYWKK